MMSGHWTNTKKRKTRKARHLKKKKKKQVRSEYLLQIRIREG